MKINRSFLVSVSVVYVVFAGYGERPRAAQLPVNGIDRSTFADIAATITPAIVSVLLTKIDTVMFCRNPFSKFFDGNESKEPFGEFFGPSPKSKRDNDEPEGPECERRPRREFALGSGVIVSAEGFVLTNYHVVVGADDIKVKLFNGETFAASVIGLDSLSDVSVIQIKNARRDLPVAPLGDEVKARPGDWVLAIGNPFSLSSTVTLGIISALNRKLSNSNLIQNYIQTDAAVNPGNSGGALVNIEGKVIGINTMIYTENGGFMGIGFAIPITQAQKVMDELIRHGRVIRGWIGLSVQDLNDEARRALNLGSRTEGVLVADVYRDQPAEKAGIKSGDVILSFAGKRIENADQLRDRISEQPPGASVPAIIVRNEKELTVRVTIEERNEKEISRLSGAILSQLPPEKPKKNSVSLSGISFADLTPEARRHFSIPQQLQGAIVVAVEDSLTDSRTLLEEGDVITQVKIKSSPYQKVESARQLSELLRKTPRGESVLLTVRHKSSTFFVSFTQ